MGAVTRRRMSRKFVKVSEFKLMALPENQFIEYRTRGKILPSGWPCVFLVRKGSRALREIRERNRPLTIARLAQLAVQRRKKQARARTGRRS